jgi:hypothetical protein
MTDEDKEKLFAMKYYIFKSTQSRLRYGKSILSYIMHVIDSHFCRRRSVAESATRSNKENVALKVCRFLCNPI